MIGGACGVVFKGLMIGGACGVVFKGLMVGGACGVVFKGLMVGGACGVVFKGLMMGGACGVVFKGLMIGGACANDQFHEYDYGLPYLELRNVSGGQEPKSTDIYHSCILWRSSPLHCSVWHIPLLAYHIRCRFITLLTVS